MGWDGMGWDGMGWDGMGWDGMGWDGMGWDGMGWDGMGWDGMGWDGMGWDGWDGMGWDGICRLQMIFLTIRVGNERGHGGREEECDDIMGWSAAKECFLDSKVVHRSRVHQRCLRVRLQN